MPDDITTTAEAAAMDAALTEASAAVSAPGGPADRKIAELESHLRDASERALRAQAELENYRKRTQRELGEERRYAIVPLVRDLLLIVDNLERAIEAAQKTDGGQALLEGVKMVATQFQTVLAQHQCNRIEAVGAQFDPHLHQAIAQEPSDDHPAGVVTRQTQVGYKLHDRVIRPAQVFVSTGPAKPSGENAPA